MFVSYFCVCLELFYSFVLQTDLTVMDIHNNPKDTCVQFRALARIQSALDPILLEHSFFSRGKRL